MKIGEIDSTEPEGDWRPISEAPGDPRNIYVKNDSWKGCAHYLHGGYKLSGAGWYDDCIELVRPAPTHWKPYPGRVSDGEV